MKKISISLVAAALALGSTVRPAGADSFFNRFSIVDTVAPSGSLRFFFRASTPSASLSLFASGDAKAILLEAFARKAFVSVGYTPITCPFGLGGICGTVTFVSFDETGF